MENKYEKKFFLRTDILPEEIPALFSNKQIYMEFTEKDLEKIKDKVIKNLSTVPLFYNIPKSDKSERKIALLHPLAQLQAFNYIVKYEQLIVSHCKKSQYSVRSPIKRNVPKLMANQRISNELKKIEEEFNIENKVTVTSDEDKIEYLNYFSYNRYKSISEMMKSVKFRRDSYKYEVFMKLDVQRCFPSIYTHSLSWALFGDKALAKNKRSIKNCFPNDSDNIMQKINFNETHGIVVGPEFSRVIAELLFTKIDTNLLIKLYKKKYVNKKDYTIYRFIDDYFIFAHNQEILKEIEETLKKELLEFNLILNNSKTNIQYKPFNMSDESIITLKRILEEFNNSRRNLLNNKKGKGNNLVLENIIGTKAHWNNLTEKIEYLIHKFPNSKSRIVNYFLKSIRSNIIYNFKYKYVMFHILEIVSNIYTLNINYQSTNHLISIYYKMISQIKTNKQNEEIKEIEEKIFQNIYVILKNNKSKINSMYELLVFAKQLEKKYLVVIFVRF
ncbi:RNA-directed DNA polymerase [Staphylococcus hominis]